MAEKNRSIEARLVRVEFLRKGAANRAKTDHTLAATLLWPRVGIASKTYARAVSLDGMARDYGEDDWAEAILFKESVQPPSALSFQLSVPLSSDALSKALGAILKAAFTVAGDAAEAAAPTKGAGKVATAPFDAFATLAANRSASVLAQGLLPLDEALLDRGGERTVELVSPRDVVREEGAAAGGKGRPARRRVLLAKGAVAARLTISFRPL